MTLELPIRLELGTIHRFQFPIAVLQGVELACISRTIHRYVQYLADIRYLTLISLLCLVQSHGQLVCVDSLALSSCIVVAG